MCLKRSRSSEQQRERRAVALRQRERELDAVGQQAPVRQAGQRIGVRQRLDALVGGEPLGDVAERVDAADRPAAAASAAASRARSTRPERSVSVSLALQQRRRPRCAASRRL